MSKNYIHNKTILVPLGILAVLSIFIGLILFNPIIGSSYFSNSLTDSVRLKQFFDTSISTSHELIIHSLTSLNFIVLILGLLFSYLFFMQFPNTGENLRNKFRNLYNILKNEYGFIYLANIYFPKNVNTMSNILWKKSDEKIIDGYFVNGVANLINNLSLKVRTLQSGYLYHYAFTMIIGLVLFLLFFYDF